MHSFKRQVFETIKSNLGIKHILVGTVHITNIEGDNINESYKNYRKMFMQEMRCPFCLEKDIEPEQSVLIKIVFKRSSKYKVRQYFYRNITRAHYSCVQGEMCYCNAIKDGKCEFCEEEPELSEILKSKKDRFFYTIEL